jgi:hypothetical protein
MGYVLFAELALAFQFLVQMNLVEDFIMDNVRKGINLK